MPTATDPDASQAPSPCRGRQGGRRSGMGGVVMAPERTAKMLNKVEPIRPKTKPAALAGREHKLTDKQRAFACEYVKVRDATKAALAAGVPERSAASMGWQWLDRDRFPLVAAEVDRLLAQVEEQAEMSAVEIRRYVHTVMKVSLPDYFLPGDGGGWLISLDDFRRLPPHVK